MFHRPLKTAAILAVSLGLAACGGSKNSSVNVTGAPIDDTYIANNRESAPQNYERSSIWDVFGPDTSEQTANVNRYLWNASLDVLSFLPVQSVDPYTGVILTGYGTPPGGGRSYKATVHIKDAALDARALNVSLQSKGGAVSPSTARAVEDAILSRARQLRIADGKL
jgi:Domain of unknown function (DUF3576)